MKMIDWSEIELLPPSNWFHQFVLRNEWLYVFNPAHTSNQSLFIPSYSFHLCLMGWACCVCCWLPLHASPALHCGLLVIGFDSNQPPSSPLPSTIQQTKRVKWIELINKINEIEEQAGLLARVRQRELNQRWWNGSVVRARLEWNSSAEMGRRPITHSINNQSQPSIQLLISFQSIHN